LTTIIGGKGMTKTGGICVVGSANVDLTFCTPRLPKASRCGVTQVVTTADCTAFAGAPAELSCCDQRIEVAGQALRKRYVADNDPALDVTTLSSIGEVG